MKLRNIMAMHMNKKKILSVFLPITFMLCMSGCLKPKPVDVTEDEPSHIPELVTLRQKVTNLEKENTTLTAEVTILKERNKDISERAKKLAARCNTLQLEAERRTEQVKLLQDLPAERDKFKTEMEKQKARAEKLERDLKELKETEKAAKSK